MDNTLNYALSKSKHIIFETTGTSFSSSNPLKWLIDWAEKKGKNYRIILIYPIVSINDIVSRIKARTIKQLSKNKPFYRGIDTSHIDGFDSYAKMNLTHFILPELFTKRIYKIILVWNE